MTQKELYLLMKKAVIDAIEETKAIKPKKTISVETRSHRNEIEEVLKTLNELAGSRFKSSSIGNSKFISARLNEGYTVQDLIEVIKIKVEEWKGDEIMEKYLRPQTLFNAENFAKYYGTVKYKEKVQEKLEYDF